MRDNLLVLVRVMVRVLPHSRLCNHGTSLRPSTIVLNVATSDVFSSL